MQKVIINADDFGRSSEINAAVIKAHRQGVLTSTSLMVGGEAVEEAIMLAKDNPTLAVGLHLVVVSGRAISPPDQISAIVNERGYFPDDPFRIGVKYFINREAQQALAREVSAQFERFAATGLSMAHVDGHLHMHMHPTVFNLLLPLTERYGAGGIRLPRDEFWLSIHYDHKHIMTKLIWAIAFAILCQWCLRKLKDYPLTFADRVYGLMQSGQMNGAYVHRVLNHLSVPTAELYLHPSLSTESEPMGPNPDDLATLLDPDLRQFIDHHGFRLASYSSLKEG
jgi:hopanoid biosynthesis associated protein HpnK